MFLRPREARVRDDELYGAAELISTERRALFLFGPIVPYAERHDIYSPTRVLEGLLALSLESHEPVTLFISSGGGQVSTGMELYDAIRMSPAPVTTIGLNCASLATVVLAAGHRRLLIPHAQIMMHLPRIEAAGGSERDFSAVSQELTRLKNMIIECYRECGVRRSADEILHDIDHSFFLDAAAAIEYGLADALVAPEDLYGPKAAGVSRALNSTRNDAPGG